MTSLSADLPSAAALLAAAPPIRAEPGARQRSTTPNSVQPFVRTLEHFTIVPSPGSQDGEPSGEEPPGVWGSLDGHLPWETALREPSRLVQTGAGPTSHRGGHWFDPSIAHRCKARSETPLTALILLGGWEQSPYWEESGRSCSPARVADCERTDRDRRDQLHKTEETYTGTLIEITVVRNPARMTRMFYAQAAMRGSSAEHRPGFTGFRRGGYGGRGGAEVAECLHVVADGAIAATVAAVAELGVQPPDVGAALVPPLVQVRLVVIQQRRPAVHGLGQQLVNGLGTVEAADGFLGQAGAAHYRLDAQALRAQRLYLLIPFPCPPDQRGVRR
jgi:hypothetical protein